MAARSCASIKSTCDTVPMPPWDMVEALGTWFAGIATAGSLLLGFSILRNDRRKEESDQARRVVVWYEHPLERMPSSAVMRSIHYICNRSDAPIFVPRLSDSRGELVSPFFKDVGSGQDVNWLHPDQIAVSVHESIGPSVHSLSEPIVTFQDDKGRSWRYYVNDRALIKFDPYRPRRNIRRWKLQKK